MRILVTGGTGLIGEGLIPRLIEHGHHVRLLSRHAERDAREWPDHVEPFPADVADACTLHGAAEGCDVVIHVTGIEKESPPEITFERVNVEGTRNVVREAERAGVRRVVHVSSLGAPSGGSDYHRSKRRAEEIVRAFAGEWIVLRPGKVYGPGDDAVSMLLRLVRLLPVVPVVSSGDQRFQPIWFEDLGAAITAAAERSDLACVALDLAGNDVTSTNDVLDRLSLLTGKEPPRIGVPAPLVALGTKVAGALGISLPIDPQMLTMLLEENVIADSAQNGLAALGIAPTSLDDGLARLVDIQPEQVPGDGVGTIERKRFRADIVGASTGARDLMAALKRDIKEIMPIDFAAEPGAPESLQNGATMTAALPVRGTVQMRVEDETDERVILATLRGHPIAGVVCFHAADLDDGALRFEVVVYWQAASVPDWMILKTAGAPIQNANWVTVVRRMIERSGGRAPDDVQTEMKTLDDDVANDVEQRIRALVLDRRRAEHRDRAHGRPA